MINSGRIYYGWVILGTLAVTEITSWGILYYTFSVLLGPMSRDLGWSRVELTGAFSMALLISGLVGVPVGRLLDRHGTRLLMTVGSCAASLLVLAWAAASSLPMFYLTWAGIGVALSAVLYEPAFAAAATWFRRYRSRALTVLTFSGGFASVIYVPLAAYLVTKLGWREALVVLAVILALFTVLPHALLLRRRPSDMGLLVDGEPPLLAAGMLRAGGAQGTLERVSESAERSATVREAVRGPSFWGLAMSFALVNFAASAISFHLIPYMTDRGYAPEFAATVVGGVGLLALPGRLVFTPLGSHVSRTHVTALLFALQAAGLVMLVTIEGSGGIWLFAVLFGVGFGALTPARAALVVERYGPASYGSINGVFAFVVTTARALAPIVVGLGTALSGGYSTVFWLLAILSALAIISLYLSSRRAGRAAPFMGQSLNR
ncbi:MAG: MFS transporter [Chloroflexota bacterium]|nr:MFS transporter [Chloroflexota bacterium]